MSQPQQPHRSSQEHSQLHPSLEHNGMKAHTSGLRNDVATLNRLQPSSSQPSVAAAHHVGDGKQQANRKRSFSTVPQERPIWRKRRSKFLKSIWSENVTKLLIRTPPDVSTDRPYVIIDDLEGPEGQVLLETTPSTKTKKLLSQFAKPAAEDADKRVTVLDENRNLLLHKLSSSDRARAIKLSRWGYLKGTIELAQKWTKQRDVNDKDGVQTPSTTFMSFGSRRNFRNGRIEKYGFKTDTPEEVKAELEARVQKLVNDLELGCTIRFPYRHVYDSNRFKATLQVDDVAIAPPKGLATHLMIAQGYYSEVLVSKSQLSYTAISCLSPERYKNKEFRDQVLFYVVPMCTGDIVFLDPAVPHCFTKPRVDDCYTIVLHTSPKTYSTNLDERFK